MNAGKRNFARLERARIVVLVLAALLSAPLGGAEIGIDCTQKYQVIHGFGTCLKGWGDPAKDPVVKWQGDPKAAELYAKELGLSIVRIPLDKFVLEGENPYKIPSSVSDEIRADATKIRHENFAWDHPDRRGDRNGDGAIRWAQAVLKLNPQAKVMASVWSPPHWMKEELSNAAKGREFGWSKFGTSSCGGRLAPKYYTHYAHYLAQWCLGLEKKFNVPLFALSVQNELHFWEPYDSCIYTPSEFAAVVKEVGRVFKELGVKTKLMGPEDMTKMSDRLMSFVKPVLADPAAKDALAIICSHGYSDGIESDLKADDARKLRDMVRETGKEYWMTETGGGAGTWEKAESEFDSGPKKGQKFALPGALKGLGMMLHSALAHGDASVWCTWQFLGPDQVNPHGLVQATMEELKPTKKFYIQKQFSRFIPPGARRVETGPDQDGLYASAFLHEAKGVLAIVLQNHTDAEVPVELKVTGGPAVTSFETWCTTKEKNCEQVSDTAAKSGKVALTLPAQCIVTLVNAPKP